MRAGILLTTNFERLEMKLTVARTAHRCLLSARNFAPMLAALALAPLLLAPSAHAQAADSKPDEARPNAEIYQSIYLNNITQQNDANEVVNGLRNMISKARVYLASSQNAILVHGSAEDIALAQKIVADLDRPRKVYRLTYSIAETDGGKRSGAQRYSLLAVAGDKTTLKQGSRVPIVTGTGSADSPGAQVQYVDVGLHIEATLDGRGDGLRLRTKVEQTSLSDEKPGVSQDPVLRQTVLDGEATLVPGKPLILGSLDVPGVAHRQEIEVLAELVP
jgi:type II secretory pathway component GspD/PulD (secretin)